MSQSQNGKYSLDDNNFENIGGDIIRNSSPDIEIHMKRNTAKNVDGSIINQVQIKRKGVLKATTIGFAIGVLILAFQLALKYIFNITTT